MIVPTFNDFLTSHPQSKKKFARLTWLDHDYRLLQLSSFFSLAVLIFGAGPFFDLPWAVTLTVTLIGFLGFMLSIFVFFSWSYKKLWQTMRPLYWDELKIFSSKDVARFLNNPSNFSEGNLNTQDIPALEMFVNSLPANELTQPRTKTKIEECPIVVTHPETQAPNPDDASRPQIHSPNQSQRA